MTTSDDIKAAKISLLEALARTGDITEACEWARVSRHQHARWMRDDAQYHAEVAGILGITIEREIKRRAIDGYEEITTEYEFADGARREVKQRVTRKYSDAALIRLAERYINEYRQRSAVELTGKDGGAIEIETNARDRIASTIASLAARIPATDDTQQSE